MKTTPIKTIAQVQAEFLAAGITISGWARANGFHRMTVVDLLRGARQGLRGETHRCAVALGLKDGVVIDVADFKPATKSAASERREQARRERERRDQPRRDGERRAVSAA